MHGLPAARPVTVTGALGFSGGRRRLFLPPHRSFVGTSRQQSQEAAAPAPDHGQALPATGQDAGEQKKVAASRPNDRPRKGHQAEKHPGHVTHEADNTRPGSAQSQPKSQLKVAPKHKARPRPQERDAALATPEEKPETREPWRVQKEALKEKFPEGWRPRKRLSPDALAGIRALNAQFPDVYTTSALADKFEVSAESIRRILRSKWTPSADEEQARQERWFRRGKQVWERKAALGIKPPKKWRREGIVRDVEWHERRGKAILLGRQREEEEKHAYRERRARSRHDAGRG